MAYKKCPRCSLNYIQDTELLCKICLEEVGKAIRANEDDEEEYDICPECGENIIKTGEEMCLQCLVEHMRDEVGAENRKKNDWGDYLPKGEDDPYDDDDEIDDEELGDLREIELDEDFEDSESALDEGIDE